MINRLCRVQNLYNLEPLFGFEHISDCTDIKPVWWEVVFLSATGAIMEDVIVTERTLDQLPCPILYLWAVPVPAALDCGDSAAALMLHILRVLLFWVRLSGINQLGGRESGLVRQLHPGFSWAKAW